MKSLNKMRKKSSEKWRQRAYHLQRVQSNMKKAINQIKCRNVIDSAIEQMLEVRIYDSQNRFDRDIRGII